MKNICLCFQVHQPFLLRKFRFYEIGENSGYFDETANYELIQKVAEKCYLPANRLMLELINKHEGDFKISYSISGTALDQFEKFMPEVMQSFKDLAQTGHVEFLAETYAHSLCLFKSKAEFIQQLKAHAVKIHRLFGQAPSTFRNTELIYSDFVGDTVYKSGFNTMLTEGADKILCGRSPNFVYNSASSPGLRLLLRNYKLSDDITFRFSDHSWKEWPFTAEKFIYWLEAIPENENLINLFMDYETFGEHQWSTTGIFEFIKAFPEKAIRCNMEFLTPSMAAQKPAYGELSVPSPISWADEERDLSAWLGNDMQIDAFDNLYKLEEKVQLCTDENIKQDWLHLQTSDHFYYMCKKHFSDGDVHRYFNPYDSPFDAYINFMNVLSDFIIRIDCHLDQQAHPSVPFQETVSI